MIKQISEVFLNDFWDYFQLRNDFDQSRLFLTQVLPHNNLGELESRFEDDPQLLLCVV